MINKTTSRRKRNQANIKLNKRKNKAVKIKALILASVLVLSATQVFAKSGVTLTNTNPALQIAVIGLDQAQQADVNNPLNEQQAKDMEEQKNTNENEVQAAVAQIQLAGAEIQLTKTPKEEAEENYQKIIKANPLLTLVNPTHFVPFGWNINLVKLKNGQAIDKRAYPELQKMINAAKAKGLKIVICSSYRTNEKQTQLFTNKVAVYKKQGNSEEDAKRLAGQWVALPGTSEHELGLAVDLVSEANRKLDKSQEKTAVQKWLMKNSWQYGFILRYPVNKKDITGINYEPWHYRYVGKEAAKIITEKGICLEEYYNIIKK